MELSVTEAATASLTVCFRPRPGSGTLKRVLTVTELPLSSTVSQLRVRAGLPSHAALFLGRLPFVVADGELLGALCASGFGLPSGPPVLVFTVE